MVVTIRLAQRELVGAFWVLTITPVVSGLSATNYTFSPSNGTLTINKATISGTAANPSVTYDGSYQNCITATDYITINNDDSYYLGVYQENGSGIGSNNIFLSAILIRE